METRPMIKEEMYKHSGCEFSIFGACFTKLNLVMFKGVVLPFLCLTFFER